MGIFSKMVNAQAILFLYLAVGFYCRKSGLFDSNTRDKLSDFTIRIVLPCMVFESFHMEFSLDTLKEGMLALVIASVMALISLPLGKVLYNRFPPGEKSVLQYGTLVTNSAFAGFSIVSETYGSHGLFLASIFIIPTRILMWSAGISLFDQTGSRMERAKKILLNPAILAVELGLVRMVFQLPLPQFLDAALDHIGDCTAPLAMILAGSILADVELRTLFAPQALYLVLVRQILLPLLCLAGLKLFAVDPVTAGVSVVLTGMPIGSTTAILAQKYGANAQFASKCVFISTISSLATVPLLTLLL